MAKNSITDYDNTAANNTDIQSVDIDEGCAPSGINNAIRELMADLADVNDGTVPLASPDINGGTIDGVTIGGTTAGAGTFTTGTFSDDLTVATNTFHVDVSSDKVSIGTLTGVRALTVKETGTSAIAHFESDQTSSKIYFNDANTSQTYSVSIGSVGDDMAFYAASGGNERMRIDSSGNVGIGTSSPESALHVNSGTTNTAVTLESTDSACWQVMRDPTADIFFGNTGGDYAVFTGGTESMRIDSSGNLLVGKTVTTLSTSGIGLAASGEGRFTRDGDYPLLLNRKTSDGGLVLFYKDGSPVGSIGSYNGVSYYGGTAGGIMFNGADINPTNGTSARTDNTNDIGALSFRFDDIYATNGTIQTSDRNEKENIASMSDAEITAAKAIGKLFKTFKWKDAVAKKGDAARTHTGVIAQDVQQAMADAGLDAGDYAFFISSTWWETQTEVPAVEAVDAVDAVYEDVVIEAVLDDEGNEIEPERTEQRLVSESVEAVEAKEAYTRTDTYDTAEEAPEGATERTRLGIRYPELLAFVGAATEQRLANIETRLEALEGA